MGMLIQTRYLAEKFRVESYHRFFADFVRLANLGDSEALLDPKYTNVPANHRPIPNANIANLLINNESTAVYALSGRLGRTTNQLIFEQGAMMAVNYHNGHSEGHHRIVIQNPRNKKAGQEILWCPPESNNTEFMHRKQLLSDKPYEFEESPCNSLKIRNHWLYTGSPADARAHFTARGFTFSPDSLLEVGPEAGILRTLSRENRSTWQNPLAR
jgi:hypothetical protein